MDPKAKQEEKQGGWWGGVHVRFVFVEEGENFGRLI